MPPQALIAYTPRKADDIGIWQNSAENGQSPELPGHALPGIRCSQCHSHEGVRKGRGHHAVLSLCPRRPHAERDKADETLLLSSIHYDDTRLTEARLDTTRIADLGDLITQWCPQCETAASASKGGSSTHIHHTSVVFSTLSNSFVCNSVLAL